MGLHRSHDVLMQELAIAVNAWGWMAWEAFTPRCACPYAAGSWFAQHWLAGWDAADEVDGSLLDAKPIKLFKDAENSQNAIVTGQDGDPPRVGQNWPDPLEPGVPVRGLHDGYHWMRWAGSDEFTVGFWDVDNWAWSKSFAPGLLTPAEMARLDYEGPLDEAIGLRRS